MICRVQKNNTYATQENRKVQKRYFFSDFELFYDRKQILQSKNQLSVTQFLVENSIKHNNSIKKSITESKQTESTVTNEGGFNIGAEAEVTAGAPLINVFKVTTNAKVDTSFNWSSSTTTSLLESKTSEIICSAEKLESVKCSLFVETTKLLLPYQYKKSIEFYDGTVGNYTVKGSINSIFSSDVQMSQCCTICNNNATFKKTPCLGATNVEPKKGQEQQPITINTSVITNIKIFRSQNVIATCPPGMVSMMFRLNSGTEAGPAFIRSRDEKTLLSLCLEKTRLSDIHPGTDIINDFRMQDNNPDCDTIKLLGDSINGNFNMDWSENKLYLCYGNNPYVKQAPIVDMFFRQLEVDDYKSDNCELIGLFEFWYYYLCVQRDITLPKKIEISNIRYDEILNKQIALPKELTRIEVAGGSISKTLLSTTKTSSKSGFSFQVGFSVSVGLTTGDDFWTGVKASFKLNIGGNYKRSSENVSTDENTESTTVTCEAPNNKKVRCSYFQTEQNFSVDYTARYTYILYDDTKGRSDTFGGTIEGNKSSSVSVSVCCVENCEPEETKCI